MKLKQIYPVLYQIDKRKINWLPKELLSYLHKNELIEIIPEQDYNTFYANSEKYKNLEKQIDRLSEEKADITDERNNLKDTLNSFLYRVFHTNNTLTTQKNKLSKLEKELITLEANINPKIEEKEKSSKIIKKLNVKYVFEDNPNSKDYIKFNGSYVSLTRHAEKIIPLIRKTIKKRPNESYETFEKDFEKMLREQEIRRRKILAEEERREEEDSENYTISFPSMGGGSGGGSEETSSGGFSGGGGSSGGGGATGSW